jgi:anti-anti-sigma factor
MEITNHYLTPTAQDINVVTLDGRFDAYETPFIQKWFEEHPNPKKIVINLRNVAFMDASGLSTLVKGLKTCRQNNGDLYLCELQDSVRNIFQLTRLDRIFSIYNNENAALQAFSYSAEQS